MQRRYRWGFAEGSGKRAVYCWRSSMCEGTRVHSLEFSVPARIRTTFLGSASRMHSGHILGGLGSRVGRLTGFSWKGPNVFSEPKRRMFVEHTIDV
jgi:hypothetical protein